MEEKLMSIHDVMEYTGFSRKTIYRRLDQGEFPDPIRFGASNRWDWTELRKFVHSLPRGIRKERPVETNETNETK